MADEYKREFDSIWKEITDLQKNQYIFKDKEVDRVDNILKPINDRIDTVCKIQNENTGKIDVLITKLDNLDKTVNRLEATIEKQEHSNKLNVDELVKKFVLRADFLPIKSLVYGFVALVLTAFVFVLIKTVWPHADIPAG